MDHLADAPIANILIIAGVIFLAVGLFGRVGGFIGSIFGNIEAGKNSRMLAGAFGVCLILGGGWLHERSDKAATKSYSMATPAATPLTTTDASSPVVIPAAEIGNLRPTSEFDDRLLGTWDNLTPRFHNQKRVEISRSEQGLSAHVWFSCPSGDCDKGSFPVKMSQGVPMYDYATPHRHAKTSLHLFSPQVLLVSVDISQPDRSWRNNWVFAKSTMPDKMRDNFTHYFDSANPKALAAAPSGPLAPAGGSSAEDAKKAALRNCEKDGVQGCKVILVNDDAAD